MNVGAPHAVFLIGGAANGKSTALRLRYCLVDDDGNPVDEDDVLDGRPLIHRDRKLDPDDFKMGIPMFTFAVDDDDSHERFGVRGLGGPSGPRSRSDYNRYKLSIRQAVEANLLMSLGVTLEGFVERWLLKENPDFPHDDDWNFGGGLTHELSKALAERNLRLLLNETQPTDSFAWDAIGNAIRYQQWIEQAHEAGYLARVIYVQAPLPVAHMWAKKRKRKLPPEMIIETYKKAAEAAREMEQYVSRYGNAEILGFQRIPRGEECLAKAEEEGYTESGPPR